jgi:hypothetical protein
MVQNQAWSFGCYNVEEAIKGKSIFTCICILEISKSVLVKDLCSTKVQINLEAFLVVQNKILWRPGVG